MNNTDTLKLAREALKSCHVDDETGRPSYFNASLVVKALTAIDAALQAPAAEEAPYDKEEDRAMCAMLNEMEERLDAQPEQQEPQTSELTPHQIEVRLQDYPRLLEFYSKYALGSKVYPSCFMCGSNENEKAITHLELADIYVCKKCVTAKQPALTDAQIDELMHRHTGISQCQFPEQYAEILDFARALLAAQKDTP